MASEYREADLVSGHRSSPAMGRVAWWSRESLQMLRNWTMLGKNCEGQFYSPCGLRISSDPRAVTHL